MGRNSRAHRAAPRAAALLLPGETPPGLPPLAEPLFSRAAPGGGGGKGGRRNKRGGNQHPKNNNIKNNHKNNPFEPLFGDPEIIESIFANMKEEKAAAAAAPAAAAASAAVAAAAAPAAKTEPEAEKTHPASAAFLEMLAAALGHSSVAEAASVQFARKQGEETPAAKAKPAAEAGAAAERATARNENDTHLAAAQASRDRAPFPSVRVARLAVRLPPLPEKRELKQQQQKQQQRQQQQTKPQKKTVAVRQIDGTVVETQWIEPVVIGDWNEAVEREEQGLEDADSEEDGDKVVTEVEVDGGEEPNTTPSLSASSSSSPSSSTPLSARISVFRPSRFLAAAADVLPVSAVAGKPEQRKKKAAAFVGDRDATLSKKKTDGGNGGGGGGKGTTRCSSVLSSSPSSSSFSSSRSRSDSWLSSGSSSSSDLYNPSGKYRLGKKERARK